MSGFFSLDRKDLLKGLVVAVLAAVLTWAAQVLNAPGFDVSSVQWSEIARIALMAGFSYLGKNLMTAENGKVGGVL